MGKQQRRGGRKYQLRKLTAQLQGIPHPIRKTPVQSYFTTEFLESKNILPKADTYKLVRITYSIKFLKAKYIPQNDPRYKFYFNKENQNNKQV